MKMGTDSNDMEQFTQKKIERSQRQIVRASEYSAHIQEAMRHDQLGSSEYPLVMTILDAVLQGYTEEGWQEGQKNTLKDLRQQNPKEGRAHTDKANRYEQMISCLKDLSLWPW